MNFILTMFICASTAQGIQCLPPVKFDLLYKDGYDCMVDGYIKAHDKLVAIGRDEINKNKISHSLNFYSAENGKFKSIF